MKKTHIAGIVLIMAAIGAIMSTMVDASTYVTFEKAAENPDRQYHVVGQLNKEKDMIYDPSVDANLFTFYLVDQDSVERKVLFNGARPQDFERSEQVVIIGKASGDNFAASKLLLKCPSKYNDGGNEELKEYSAEENS